MPIDSIIATIGQHFQNRANQRFAVQQSNIQHQRTKELWNMDNLYNSPEQQMQRLKAAGLNPNLVYGKGATATSKGPPSTPQQANWQGQNPMERLNTIGAFQDIKLKQAQLGNIDASTQETLTNTAGKQIQNAISEIDKRLEQMKESWRFARTDEPIRNKSVLDYPSNFRKLEDAKLKLIQQQASLAYQNVTYQGQMNQFFKASKYVGFAQGAINAIINGAKLSKMK